MNVYLAGWPAATAKRIIPVIRDGGLKNRCLSFANLVKMQGMPYHLAHGEAEMDACISNGVGIMMDSGVFSYRSYGKRLRAAGQESKLISKDEFIRLYVEWCKKHGHRWDFYVTMDFEKNAAENLKSHVQLEKMGIRPMPVYHGDDDAEYLKRYADKGYKYICIGLYKPNRKAKRRYLDTVFNAGVKYGIEYHGLGVTTPWIMLDYPWRSVDSSSWSRVAGYGGLVRLNEKTMRLSVVHVSERASDNTVHNAKLLARVRKHVELEGFDWGQLTTGEEAHVYRHVYNAKTMTRLAALAALKNSHGQWRSLI